MILSYKNPCEAAWCIKDNNYLTVAQKHEGWRALMDCTEDCPFHSHGVYDEGNTDSLHTFLSEYIAMEEYFLKRFYEKEANAVYTYMLWCDEEGWIGEDGPLYGDLEEALCAFRDDADLHPPFGLLQKRYVGAENQRIMVRLRPEDGAVMGVGEEWIVNGDDHAYKTLYSVWWGISLMYEPASE